MTDFTKLAADIETRIVNLTRIVNPGCTILESHGWIVVYPGSTTAYAFDVVDKRATNPRVGKCESVNRFTKEDAQRVADNCTDGKGDPLTIGFYRDVCAEELVIMQGLLPMIQEHIAA